jgi:hypothetical protein
MRRAQRRGGRLAGGCSRGEATASARGGAAAGSVRSIANEGAPASSRRAATPAARGAHARDARGTQDVRERRRAAGGIASSLGDKQAQREKDALRLARARECQRVSCALPRARAAMRRRARGAAVSRRCSGVPAPRAQLRCRARLESLRLLRRGEGRQVRRAVAEQRQCRRLQAGVALQRLHGFREARLAAAGAAAGAAAAQHRVRVARAAQSAFRGTRARSADGEETGNVDSAQIGRERNECPASSGASAGRLPRQPGGSTRGVTHAAPACVRSTHARCAQPHATLCALHSARTRAHAARTLT